MTRRVTSQQVIDLALKMEPSINPFTDLVSYVRQTYGVSGRVAGNVAGNVVRAGLITQTWTTAKVYSPSQAGNSSSDPYWTMDVAKWQLPEATR